MFTDLLKPVLTKVHPVTIEEVRHNIQKEKRIIDVLEPVMNQHKLVIDMRALEKDYSSVQHYPPEKQPKYMLAYQMTRITRDKGALRHDDQIDALAIAANAWVERMDRDQILSYNQHKEDLLDKELERFMESTIGRQPHKDSWI